MNKVIVDGVELQNVTVTITDGVAVITDNKTGKVVNYSGGGPGEEGGGSGGKP